jgi:hypothetical protein
MHWQHKATNLLINAESYGVCKVIKAILFSENSFRKCKKTPNLIQLQYPKTNADPAL